MNHDQTILMLIDAVEALTQKVETLEQENGYLAQALIDYDQTIRNEIRDVLRPHLIEELQETVREACQRRPVVLKADGSPDHTAELLERLDKLERNHNRAQGEINQLFEFKGQHLMDHETNGGNPRELSPFELSKKISHMHHVAKR